MTTFTQRPNGKWRVQTDKRRKKAMELWLDALATIAALSGALYLASLI